MFHRTKPTDGPSPETEAAASQSSNAASTTATTEHAETEKDASMNSPANQADQNTENNNQEANASRSNVEIPGASPFQRSQQPQAAAPASRPGFGFGSSQPQAPSFGATPAASPIAGSSLSPQSQAQGRRLVIGEGITMSGEIEACDHLVVEGTVDASLKGSKVLEISSTGTFYGTVEIEEATIAGRFEGDILCNGRLTVRSNGAITGSISYKELAIEPGAMLDGRISPIGSANAGAAGKNTKGRAAAAVANKDQKTEGGELFGARRAGTAAE